MPKQERGINESTGLSGADSLKALARARIDEETSAAICAGFDYMVNEINYHFNYDRDDQQNFADSANVANMVQATQAAGGSTAGMPTSVEWNGYTADGALVRLALDIPAFLGLYMAALAHKSACMTAGGIKKAELEA